MIKKLLLVGSIIAIVIGGYFFNKTSQPADILTGATTVLGRNQGGTGLSTFTAGDMIWASSSNQNRFERTGIGSPGTCWSVTGATTLGWTSCGGGTGADTDIPFITVGNTASLSFERALTGTSNQITVTDNGANSTMVLSIPNSFIMPGYASVSNNFEVAGIASASSFIGNGQNLRLATLGASTYKSVQDLQNIFHSSGWISGGDIASVSANVVSVSAGTGLIRAANSATSTVYFMDWPASSSVNVLANGITYIGVEYNGGSPRVTVRSSVNWNYKTDFPLGRVSNGPVNGKFVVDDVQGVGDHAANMIRREYETMPLDRDARDGGLMLSESADGNRKIAVTAGAIWDRLNRYTINAFDSAIGQTFTVYIGSTASVSATTIWPNSHYNNGGVWTGMSVNKYANLWFYQTLNDGVIMVYGTNEYANAAAAELESEPSVLPNRIISAGKLLGRLIFQNGATTATAVESAFTTTFTSVAASNHANLTNLDYANSGHTGFAGTGTVNNTFTGTNIFTIASVSSKFEFGNDLLDITLTGVSSSLNFDLTGLASASKFIATNNGTVNTPSFQLPGGPGIYLAAAGKLGLTTGASGITWDGAALYPNTDNIRTLGLTTNRWIGLFSVNASISTALEVLGTASVSGAFTQHSIASNSFLGSLSGQTTGTLSVGTSNNPLKVLWSNIIEAVVSFFLPARTASNVTSAGAAAVNTASNSFNFYGSAETVLGRYDKCISSSLTSGDLTNKNQWTIFTADDPYTVALIQATASGSNSMTWNLLSGSPTVPTTNIATHQASGSAIAKYSSFSSTAIADGNKLDIYVSSTSAALDSVYIRVCMTKDK